MTPVYGQSPPSSPAPPLAENEKRLILSQLYELGSCRAQVLAYEEFVSREKEQDQKERDLAARALELEKQATALAQRERNLEKDRADTFEQLYRAVTKKPGWGCRILKVLTFGLSGCH